MEELKECPACKATSQTFIRECKDFTVSSEKFRIVQCNECFLQFTNPRPNSLEIGRYYESKEYISHSNSSAGWINKLYKFIRTYSIQSKIRLIERFNKNEKKTILDIGCGTGEFLGMCKKAGWNTIGIEPNDKARNQAEHNWGLQIYSEDFLENKNGGFKPTIISMWHVLEHVHSLRRRLEQIQHLIAQNGHLIIAVPNPESHDAAHYSNYWAAYDVPRHLYHFKPAVIKAMVSKFGFEHVKSQAMPFDSFYVSMLSEKYKHGKNRLAAALFEGLRSNYTASGNPEKYSSVIYIFKKI